MLRRVQQRKYFIKSTVWTNLPKCLIKRVISNKSKKLEIYCWFCASFIKRHEGHCIIVHQGKVHVCRHSHVRNMSLHENVIEYEHQYLSVNLIYLQGWISHNHLDQRIFMHGISMVEYIRKRNFHSTNLSIGDWLLNI